MQRQLRNAYSGQLTLQTLSQTAEFVDKLIRSTSPILLLKWFLSDIGMFGATAQRTIERFNTAADGALPRLLPYTAYCVRIALIFHFALAFNLVGTRATNRVDLEYLFYVPFCNAFSSGDAFLRKLAELVMTNQTYISRDALKADLNELSKWWESLSPEQLQTESRLQGPPENEKSVTHQMWTKTMKPGYRNPARRQLKLTDEENKKMLKRFREIAKKRPASGQPFQGSMDDCDFVLIPHMVRADGPCICGSTKLFKDCCGRELVKSLESKHPPQT